MNGKLVGPRAGLDLVKKCLLLVLRIEPLSVRETRITWSRIVGFGTEM